MECAFVCRSCGTAATCIWCVTICNTVATAFPSWALPSRTTLSILSPECCACMQQELTARFSLQLGASSLPGLWGNLSHALGGLFCASLNFVARPEATAVQTISMEQSSPCSPPAPAPAAAGAAAGRTAGRGQMPFDSSSSPHGSVERCKFLPGAAPQHVLYAALPQEASCTENLTPWLKLLPCRWVSEWRGIGMNQWYS